MFAGITYAEPGAMGLVANAIPALVMGLTNVFVESRVISTSGTLLSVPWLILVGGLTQCMAGLVCFRKYDHFGGTLFVLFAAYWATFGGQALLNAAEPSLRSAGALTNGVFMVVCFCFIGIAMTVNKLFTLLLVTLTIATVFQLAAAASTFTPVPAGVFELLLFFVAVYGAAALLFRGVARRHLLPFMQSPFIELQLVQRKGVARRTGTAEATRNTKYGEPYALGLFSNAVMCGVVGVSLLASAASAIPLAEGSVAPVGFAVGCGATAIAALIAFRRGDMLYGTIFALDSMYWLMDAVGDVVWIAAPVRAAFPNRAAGFEFGIALFGLVLVLLSATTSKVMFVTRLIFNIVMWLRWILDLAAPVAPGGQATVGVIFVILGFIECYGGTAYLLNARAEKMILHIGRALTTPKDLGVFVNRIARRICCCATFSEEDEEAGLSGPAPLPNAPLGYSDFPSSHVLGLVSHGVTAIVAITALNHLVIVDLSTGVALAALGGGVGAAAAAMSFSRGETFISAALVTHAIAWSVVAGSMLIPYVLPNVSLSDASMAFGAFALLLIVICLAIASAAVSKAWMCVLIADFLGAIGAGLTAATGWPMVIAQLILGGVAMPALILAAIESINWVCGAQVIPTGIPLLKWSADEALRTSTCPTGMATKESGIVECAEVLAKGGVVGLPTDTVYALGCGVRHPDAVRRIYQVKKRPKEKPISLWIRSIKDIQRAAPDFPDILWRFMERIWPGPVSLVVKRGAWLGRMGLGDAADLIGTGESIAIRVPDSVIVLALIDKVGPLAITSANPSGEADTTHHNQVIQQLGDRIDFCLCDGPSRENVASTVVDCSRIGEGVLSFFRVGCVPEAWVWEQFRAAQNWTRNPLATP